MTPSELSDLLWAQVDRVAPHLLPNGKKEGHEWVAGNVNGDKGNSLKVNLSGKKKWADFAEGDGGDMLDLWMACRGINLHQAMQEAKAFLGIKDDDHHFDAKREKKFSRPDRKKIARYVTGPDAKGYASRHGSVVKRIAEGLLMDINEGADWATSLAIEDGADHYLWDGDGVGAGLRRQTTEAFSGKKITATMFKGSESPFDEDAPYQAGAWADEVVQGDNVRTIGDVFRNKRAQFYYALADRLYLTYRAVVYGEYADPDDMLSFDKESIRGQNISAQNAALSREIQRAELQEKALDRQIARESNQLKLEELKQKQADVRQKADIARADRQAAAQGAVDTFSTALDSLNEIEQSPGLSKAVGIRSAFPTVPGSDAANFEARLDTFKAQTFLPMVQSLKGMGALSDAEGKKLSDAVGALSPKMSEKAFRDSIGKIRNQLESKLSTVKKQFDYQEPVQNTPGQQSTTGSNFSSLWGD